MPGSPDIRIVAVGDLMLGDSPVRFGFGSGSAFAAMGVPRAAQRLKGLLGEADLTFGNLEVPISNRGWDLTDYVGQQFLAHPDASALLRECGFDALHVANNHIMQHGQAVFDHTMASVEAAGISVIGKRSGGQLVPCNLVTAGGVRVCVFGVSMRPEVFADGPVDYAQVGDPKEVVALFKAAKPECDLCIIQIHWGWEYLTHASPMQKQLAEEILDAGADIIIGHHPHVLQPVERVGRKVTAYSLGNFVFDMTRDITRLSAVLSIEWNPEHGVTSVTAKPVYLDKDGWPQDATPDKAKAITDILGIGSDLGPRLETDQDAYLKRAERHERIHSYHNRWYFFTHLHRYAPGIRSQAIRHFFRRRVKEKKEGDG